MSDNSTVNAENSSYIVNIQGEEHYQQQVIEASKQQPVLVDFWADWCQPCQILIPLLTHLANEYKGSFILAKVNSDEQQALAAAHGIRSLPTVRLYKDGQIVDEFMGAKAESEIRQFLDQHVLNETDMHIAQAMELADNGHFSQAVTQLQALNQQDPGNKKVYIAIARVYLQSGDLDNCSAIIKALPANIQTDAEVKKLNAELELAIATADAPATDEILAQLESDPENSELLMQLSRQYIVNKNYEQALQTLMQLLSRDINFQEGAAKQSMLSIFETLGAQDPLTRTYRSRLASLLY